MLLLNTQVQNIPVMSLQTGAALGTATSAIIDPRKLIVTAYYVAGPRIQTASVLHTSDIREFGPLGFIVDGTESVMDLDQDLVRLQEVINFKFELIGKLVIDENKKKLGKVSEYALETEGFTIQKLHISQSLMKNLGSSKLVIHRSQIVEINDRQIIVRAATVPKAVGLAQVMNPFRKTPAGLAPDTADTDRSST